jgi:hypothetical protein
MDLGKYVRGSGGINKAPFLFHTAPNRPEIHPGHERLDKLGGGVQLFNPPPDEQDVLPLIGSRWWSTWSSSSRRGWNPCFTQ